ncbi:hypothetical protein C8R44DRAFT_364042 [Mycena epipterygia]|nr:hypothetical protein C8R44DRAFT_364042 [Mycena epipterygia]
MDSPQNTPWSTYVPPRNIDNLHTPWVPSPDSFDRDSALDGEDAHATLHPTTRQRFESGANPPGRNIFSLCRALRRFMSRPTEGTKEDYEDPGLYTPKCKEIPIPLSEWQAFAAYSRPTVNGVDVHNTFTPSPTPYRNIDLDDLDEVDVHEVFASLRSPGGGIHPELWVRGLQHPSLPPSPAANWPLPQPGEPLTFPWECQINPFLAHTVCGPAPVYWNIRTGGLSILRGGPLDISIPLSAVDLAQPATHPLLTHMYVSGLALTDARFPWKFMIINPAGIRVRDVFRAILDNFQHYVFRAEYEAWPAARQQRAELEWALRGGQETQDGLRRVDYLCGQLYFRGLAPNPDRTGWVLFVGGEW